jgi:hypothetical protein
MKIKIPFGFRRCYNCQINVKGRRTQTCTTCGGHLGKNEPKPKLESEAGETTRTVFSFPQGYNIPDDAKGIQLANAPLKSVRPMVKPSRLMIRSANGEGMFVKP